MFCVVSKTTVYLCAGSGFCMCFWKRLGLFMVCPSASFPEESSVVADYYDVLPVDAGLFSGDFSWLSCLCSGGGFIIFCSCGGDTVHTGNFLNKRKTKKD